MNRIRIEPEWSKSKEEIWDEMFEHLEERNNQKVWLRRIPLWGYAASLLIPILLICHFYTVSKETARGEHLAIRFPDNSKVTMNAESKISYKPLSWFLNRKVRLEGEACFDVKHGSRFSVQSGRNIVSVLGTTFNVCARPGLYRVTCLEGQVEVHAGSESVVLHANMQAVLHEPMLLIYSMAPSIAPGWMQGEFVFVAAPLSEVIAEVERQYNINITPDDFTNHLFTGSFAKTDKPEVILEYIGKPFGITFSYAPSY